MGAHIQYLHTMIGATITGSFAVAAKLQRYPLGIVCPLIALGGLVATRVRLERARQAFVGSCALVLGLISSAAFAIFPHALPARVAGRELSLLAAAAQPSTLQGMLLWWVPGMVIAASYSYFIYTRMPATFRPNDSAH